MDESVGQRFSYRKTKEYADIDALSRRDVQIFAPSLLPSLLHRTDHLLYDTLVCPGTENHASNITTGRRALCRSHTYHYKASPAPTYFIDAHCEVVYNTRRARL